MSQTLNSSAASDVYKRQGLCRAACAKDALEVGTTESARGTQSNENHTKIGPTASQNRGKSTPEPSKIDVGCVLGGFKRSTSLLGRSRTRSERLLSATLAVLAAKLAVLAAMLAVLDGKLAAQGGPNGVRSRPRALFERARKLDR